MQNIIVNGLNEKKNEQEKKEEIQFANDWLITIQIADDRIKSENDCERLYAPLNTILKAIGK